MYSLGIAKPPSDTRVVVAMSGGVDSSVVAALLTAEGYDVVGITLQLYDSGRSAGRKGTCCAGRDIGDARSVAAQLGIAHYVLDYEARFRDAVIAPFAASYARGETPIPCASCNNSVKFTDLLAVARDLGADALATGHYCATRPLPGGRRGLFRGADASRDQSYFLFGTTREQLDFVRFPLGDLSKATVRAIAEDRGLVNAAKPDSQDICFVPSGHYGELVRRLMPEAARPGDIVDADGKVLGRHDGVANFTVGQRRGLNLGGFATPLYVTRVDPARAQVVVGPQDALRSSRLILRDLNWLGDGAEPPPALDIVARTRSTRPPTAARLTRRNGVYEVVFPSPNEAVAPGQACVFYASDNDGARVLGGGTVASWEPHTRAAASREAVSAT